MDFEEYRKQYYWFQYHYYLRSNRHLKRDKSRVAAGVTPYLMDFLYNLMLDSDTVHTRWELKEREHKQPLEQLKRIPRGKRKAEVVAERDAKRAAEPVTDFSQVVMQEWDGRKIYADKQSIRHRFMLTDWLKYKKGKKWYGFTRLYRALIVLDLVRQGRTIKEISEDATAEYFLFQMTQYRVKLGYEALFNLMPEKSFDFFSSEPLFIRIYDDDADSEQAYRFAEKDIKRLYHYGIIITSLAAFGNFQAIPTIN